MGTRDLRLERAKQAIDSIGLGFDITKDISFEQCKSGARLIQMNPVCRDLKVPGDISIPNVPTCIKCFPGESQRINSGLYTIEQMSGYFNTEMRLTETIRSGHFCAAYGLSDSGNTDSLLAFDGWFARCYSVELDLKQFGVQLSDHVLEAVPSTWDPLANARFIERFGTHVVVGVSMGGKDVFYARMEKPKDELTRHEETSFLQFLSEKANLRFTDSAENHDNQYVVIHSRKGGGSQRIMLHSEWLKRVAWEPDVISFFLLPLQRMIYKSGFLSHAINLYIKYKPPIEELHQFLDFQLPRQWEPLPCATTLASHKKNHTLLPLGIFGPMLYINTTPAEVGSRPVTGLALRLEGRKSNRLAINLEHLIFLPKSFPLSDKESLHLSCHLSACNFHKKLKWNSYSYICTAPIESEDTSSIVTGAQLLVDKHCLRLRLRFTKVIGATLHKPPEWDQFSSSSSESEGIIAAIRRCGSRHKQNGPKPGEVTVRSTIDYITLPSPVNAPKLERFVNKSQIVRGPENTPGYWLVSGAALFIHQGKISLRVKFSLFKTQMSHAVDTPSIIS